MIFRETAFQLKDGRRALLRSPLESDAAEMLAYIVRASGETDFLMKYPEEWDGFSLEQEKAFIRGLREDPDRCMIACFADGRLAGTCHISFRTVLKERHRAEVGIALLREFWDLGIGTNMFLELFRIAEERGWIRQIELNFIEGNERGRRLYEKMGFRITGVTPDAIQLKDGSLLNEYMMIKRL
ncbi:MAG: GNAT family N-acetyltransferase [Clostridia bacterium]|nr:GNAT family N-acetyltransferase [Clostridia bacterium]